MKAGWRLWRIRLRSSGPIGNRFKSLQGLDGPAVILVGRPYVAYAPEVNLSVPRKVTTRGLTVIPAMLCRWSRRSTSVTSGITRRTSCRPWNMPGAETDRYVCHMSCFSCGPDAINHHRMRRELDGQPFCFLEIDSHTAHTGIETRVGAFLDIIEASRGHQVVAAPQANRRVALARLEQEGGGTWIVTGAGRRLTLDHPQVVHVALADGPQFVSDLLAGFYSSIGWKWRFAPNTNAETLQYAKRVCSGRECLPFLSMVGKAVRYLETRSPGEVTVFHLLDQEGPCQNGAWHDAVPIIFERLGEGDALVAWPTARNNYLGKGDRFGAMKVAAFILSDIMAEVRSTLRCLAKDRGAALAILDELETKLIAASQGGLWSAERELRRAVKRLAAVPLVPLSHRVRGCCCWAASIGFCGRTGTGLLRRARHPHQDYRDVGIHLLPGQAEDIVRNGFSMAIWRPGTEGSMSVLLSELLSHQRQNGREKSAHRTRPYRIHRNAGAAVAADCGRIGPAIQPLRALWRCRARGA